MAFRNPAQPVKIKNYSMQMMTFGILTLIALGVGGYFGYTQYLVYNEATNALEAERQMEGVIASGLKNAKTKYEEISQAYEDANKNRQDAIIAVLPKDDAFRELTRQIEKYENDNNDPLRKPLFIGSLSFESPSVQAEKNYSVLPFSLNMQTTREGFDDFLEYVESSGSVEEGTRIMDIESISIGFPLKEKEAFAEEEELDLLSVSLLMNSYFQKP